MVSPTPSLGHRNADWFHGFMVLMTQRWSGRNHKTTKPWNYETYSHFDGDGVGKTTKPCWQVSWFHREISLETMKPWNYGFKISNVSWLEKEVRSWSRSRSPRTLQLLVIGTIAILRQTRSVTWHTTFKKRTQSLPPLSILTPPRWSSATSMTTARKNSSWTTLLRCMLTMSTIVVSSVTTALPSSQAVKRWKQSTWNYAQHHALEDQIAHARIDSFVFYVYSTYVDQWLCQKPSMIRKS